jgi:rare lipoprotein A
LSYKQAWPCPIALARPPIQALLVEKFKNLLAASVLGIAVSAAHAATDAEAILQQRATQPDRSGKKRIGIASYYHAMFNGRKMADGSRFDPDGINAASKSLPLGTLARVTNLETNQSAVVRIQDRGPYVDGRIIDLSPRIAQVIGITHKGLAKVAVIPIAVPMPDGTMRNGEAARGDSAQDITSSNPG